MPKLNNILLNQLNRVLSQSAGANYLDFTHFTSNLDQLVGFSYDDEAVALAAFEKGRMKYLERLNKEEKIFYLISLLFQEFSQVDQVVKFKQLVEGLFEVDDQMDNGAKWARRLFDCNLLAKNKMPFIDRADLKEYIYNLVHDEETSYLVINGESGVGLSYTSYYLSEISEATNAFKLVLIDFNSIFRRIKGQIGLVHIAEEMLLKIPEFVIPFELTRDEKFKYVEFSKALWTFLNNSEDKYLFFFDQFNVSYAEDEVENFIFEFVRSLLQGPVKNYYVILAGYKKYQEVWDDQLCDTVGNIKLNSFREEHLIDFIKNLYHFWSQQHKIEFSVDVLLDSLKQSKAFFAPEMFASNQDPSLPPNVEVIGNGIKSWLIEFKSQLQNG